MNDFLSWYSLYNQNFEQHKKFKFIKKKKVTEIKSVSKPGIWESLRFFYYCE